MRLLTVIAGVFLLSSADSAAEKLNNGIVLPYEWPPNHGEVTREPMRVPYLDNPPEIINIDVGRLARPVAFGCPEIITGRKGNEAPKM